MAFDAAALNLQALHRYMTPGFQQLHEIYSYIALVAIL